MSQRTRSSLKSGMFNPDTMGLLESSAKRGATREREKEREIVKNDKPKQPLIKLGKCAKCSVFGAVLVGSTLIVLSLSLFIFGVILKVNTSYDRFKTLTLVDPAVTPSTSIQKMNFFYLYSPIEIIAIFATFFGGSLCLIGIGAIVAACAKHKCLLGALIAYVVIILVISFAGLFFTMSYANDEVTRMLNSIVSTAVSGYGSIAAVTESLNFVQYYFSCCGVKTTTDIYPSGNFSSACCSTTSVTQDITWFGNVLTVVLPTVTLNSCSTTTKSPCYTVLSTWMTPLVIAFIVIYFILEIGLLIFLIFIFQALKAKNRVKPIQFSTSTSREKTQLLKNALKATSSRNRRKSEVY